MPKVWPPQRAKEKNRRENEENPEHGESPRSEEPILLPTTADAVGDRAAVAHVVGLARARTTDGAARGTHGGALVGRAQRLAAYLTDADRAAGLIPHMPKTTRPRTGTRRLGPGGRGPGLRRRPAASSKPESMASSGSGPGTSMKRP
jgi:hypothetical protein